jgi:hypothetical protein
MRDFGRARRKKQVEDDGIPEEYVNQGVLAAALATQGVLGAGVGLALSTVGISLFEAVSGRRISSGANSVLIGGTMLAFAMGIPAGLLKVEGRI